MFKRKSYKKSGWYGCKTIHGISSNEVDRTSLPIFVNRCTSGSKFPSPSRSSVMVLNFTTRNIFSFLPRTCLGEECSLARICNPCYYPQHPEDRTDNDKTYQWKGKIERAFEEMTIHVKNLQFYYLLFTIGQQFMLQQCSAQVVISEKCIKFIKFIKCETVYGL